MENFNNILNNKYNIGCTGFEDRYESAEKPICVAAFKADEEKEVRKFVDKNIVNKDLLDIFEKHNINKEIYRKILHILCSFNIAIALWYFGKDVFLPWLLATVILFLSLDYLRRYIPLLKLISSAQKES